MTEYTENGDARYEPTDEEFDELYGEWEFCNYCGGEKPVGVECDCQMGMREDDDFPMYLEYEGPYGLSGYDSFYDNEPSYGDW